MKRKTKKAKKVKAKKPKRKTVRSTDKLAPLKKQFNSRIRQEYLDFDYLDKLSPKELEYLAAFTAEWNAATFNHGLKRVMKKKKDKKESYDRNNARNRCSYSNTKAQGRLLMIPQEQVSEFFGEDIVVDSHVNSVEDAMIDFLDKKREGFEEDED